MYLLSVFATQHYMLDEKESQMERGIEAGGH